MFFLLYLCPSYAEEKLRTPFVCGLIHLSLDSSTPFIPPGAVFGGAYRSFARGNNPLSRR